MRLVRAQWVSSRLLVCIAPPGTALAPPVSLSVTNDAALSFSEATLNYTYLPPLTLSAVAPATGPFLGGTLLTLRGDGIDRYAASIELACHFNGSLPLITPATWHADDSGGSGGLGGGGNGVLTCRTPPLTLAP